MCRKTSGFDVLPLFVFNVTPNLSLTQSATFWKISSFKSLYAAIK